ncbi:hypothetical protein BaOVIS_016640 [Babesia ovis]|uniref:Uncharacterized protein n=1 Tax=Babesia ovis TaxID=5869 RepID=A0A9W5TB55_BABOV|nr:hypothetical protein BaOVIS_016640 [Babesia ovis]
MATLDSGFNVPPEAFLSNSSMDAIIAHSLGYTLDRNISEVKDSEDVSLLYHFLRHIWTSMTNASVYTSIEGVTNTHDVIPFLHSSKCRQQVSHRILEFLSHFREDSSDDGAPVENNSTLPMRNTAQAHLSTSFKILSSFLLVCPLVPVHISRQSGGKNSDIYTNHGFLYLIEVYIYLVPAALDLSVFFDLLTDLAKTLPIWSSKALCDFLYQQSSCLNNIFKSMQASSSNSRVIQTAGAKMIGLVRVLESMLEESGDPDLPVCIFNLRITLTSCLPISHLGVCNRQSLSVDVEPVSKASPEEWKRLVALNTVKRPHGISQFEISNYEAIAGTTGSPSGISGEIFDLKSYLGASDDRCVTSQAIPYLPAYSVYCDYCDLLDFIFNPCVITEKTQDYMDSLQSQFSSVSSYIMSLAEKTHHTVVGTPWVIPMTSNATTFISRCTSLSFWTTFLSTTSLALQTLKISHKRTVPSESIYSMLRENAAASLDNIEKTLNQCVSKISGLPSKLERLLSREKEWVLWKQRGCTAEGMDPITRDTLTSPSEPLYTSPDVHQSDMMNFVKLLSQLESLSHVNQKGLPELGVNYILSIDDLCMNRQSKAWYLPTCATEVPATSATQKMYQKLDDYIEKMRMDADPANDIDPSERSKHDPMFRFRFNRLFASRHVNKYMELSNRDFASGSIECLVESLSPTVDRATKRQKKSAETQE